MSIFVHARNYPAANIGLPLGSASGVIALDLDIDNIEIAEEAQYMAESLLGNTMIRYGRPPRCVLLYQGNLKTQRLGKVELLGEGTQVVIYGNHPAGYWYRYPDEEPYNTRPEDLPRLHESNWHDFVGYIHDTINIDARVMQNDKAVGTPFDSSDLRSARHGFGGTWYRSVAAQLSAAQPGNLHHTMVSAVAALVNKGLSDERIVNFVKEHFNAPSSGSYAEVWDQIDGAIAGARSKWK
tara:strand:- start:719 stop:1435 length:717 start_codon:yes stop_codon:yes gene_type:complete